MSIWYSMGTIAPQLDRWIQYSEPTTLQTFRITFLGNHNQMWGFARIRAYYANGETGFSRKLYPRREQLIIELPIPAEFMEAGLYVRQIGIRKYRQSRRTIPDSSWQIQLEVFVG